MSLLKSIQDGEGKTVEFKVELPNSNTLAKTIIAFSNTGGGKLIIGVNDQGEIIGLEPDVNIFEHAIQPFFLIFIRQRLMISYS